MTSFCPYTRMDWAWGLGIHCQPALKIKHMIPDWALKLGRIAGAYVEAQDKYSFPSSYLLADKTMKGKVIKARECAPWEENMHHDGQIPGDHTPAGCLHPSAARRLPGYPAIHPSVHRGRDTHTQTQRTGIATYQAASRCWCYGWGRGAGLPEAKGNQIESPSSPTQTNQSLQGNNSNTIASSSTSTPSPACWPHITCSFIAYIHLHSHFLHCPCLNHLQLNPLCELPGLGGVELFCLFCLLQ